MSTCGTSFEACPICQRSDEFLDVNGRFFLVCHTHATAWFVGVTSYSSWCQFPEDDAERVARWTANAELLITYELVEPAAGAT